MDVAAYLRRIGYTGPLQPSAETLRELHYAHLLAVPFENLDIHRRVPVVLDTQSLFRKIVLDRRGGFCYELNGLFAALLRELGFQVALLSARVSKNEDETGPEFDHLALRVELDSPWLADVGFGESFVEPLPLRDGAQARQRQVFYRIDREDDRWRLLRCGQAGPDRDWRMLYDFTLTPRALSDFEGMSRYHQTSPQSHFTRGRVCSQLTPYGRLTLTNERLVVSKDGQRQETAIASPAGFDAALRRYFAIDLNSGT